MNEYKRHILKKRLIHKIEARKIKSNSRWFQNREVSRREIDLDLSRSASEHFNLKILKTKEIAQRILQIVDEVYTETNDTGTFVH
jgi:hypothetical protein